MKETGSNMGLKRVNGEHGYVDCMISRSVMGKQYVLVSKSVMGEQIMKETGGSMGLKRVNGEQGYVGTMILMGGQWYRAE